MGLVNSVKMGEKSSVMNGRMTDLLNMLHSVQVHPVIPKKLPSVTKFCALLSHIVKACYETHSNEHQLQQI